MFIPDFSTNPGPKIGAPVDVEKATHTPEVLAGFSPHAPPQTDATFLDPKKLAEIIAQVPFKIRMLMKVAKAEFSYPTAMRHLSHPEEFVRLAQDMTLQGDPSRTPVLCVGGFGTTGQGSFRALAEYINAEGRGPIVRVVSLAGHTGSWDAMRRTTAADMKLEVERHARELFEMTGKPCACVALSTGALGALGAMRNVPDLFARHNVAIGVPLELRNSTWKYALGMLDKWQARSGRTDLFDGFHIANPTVTASEVAPVFTRMPVNSLVQFHRLRCEVIQPETLAAVSRRVFFLHGQEDSLADPNGGRKLVGRTGNCNLHWEQTYKGAGHNLLLSEVRDSIFEQVLRMSAL